MRGPNLLERQSGNPLPMLEAKLAARGNMPGADGDSQDGDAEEPAVQESGLMRDSGSLEAVQPKGAEHIAGLLGKQEALTRRGQSSSMRRSGSSRSMGGAAEPADAGSGSDNDASSRATLATQGAGSSAPKAVTPDKLAGQELVNYWIGQLPLQTVLDGKKPGVAMNQARLALNRLKAKHQTQLRAHMECVEYAKQLSVHGLGSCTPSEIAAALDNLATTAVTWPTHLMQHLWSRDMEGLTSRLLSEGNEVLVQSFLEGVLPYKLEAAGPEGPKFNYRNPRLADIPLEPSARNEFFLEWVLEKNLVAMLQDGKENMERCRLFSNWILKAELLALAREPPNPPPGRKMWLNCTERQN